MARRARGLRPCRVANFALQQVGHFAVAKLFHDTVRGMNKRALLYAGFLTAAFAVLLTSGRLHRVISDGTLRTFANR